MQAWLLNHFSRGSFDTNFMFFKPIGFLYMVYYTWTIDLVILAPSCVFTVSVLNAI
jgi:hypothetical protein